MTTIHAHANGGSYRPANGETDAEFASRVTRVYGVETCAVDHRVEITLPIPGGTMTYTAHGTS